MSSIMVTGLAGASLLALDDVAGPTRHSTAARKQPANGAGCPFTNLLAELLSSPGAPSSREAARGGVIALNHHLAPARGGGS